MKSIKEAYRSFLNTDQGTQLYNSFKLLLYKEEDSLVQTLNNNILQALSLIKKDTLDICDIGGGDGNRIIHILKFLHSKFDIRFRLDFIEQSRQFIDAFRAGELGNFSEVSRHHALFEDVNLIKKYDLVFLIHSIFAFQNGKAVEKVLSLIKPDGKIVVVSNASDSFLGGLKRLTDEGYIDKRYEIANLQQNLKYRNITFTTIDFKTKWAIDDAHFSRDLKTLLDWITLGQYDSFDSEKKKIIGKYIEDKSTKVTGRTLFSEDEVIIVIPPM